MLGKGHLSCSLIESAFNYHTLPHTCNTRFSPCPLSILLFLSIVLSISSQEASRVPACLEVVQLLLADNRLLPDHATTPHEPSSRSTSDPASTTATVTSRDGATAAVAATTADDTPKSAPGTNSAAGLHHEQQSNSRPKSASVAGRRRRSGTVDEEQYVREQAPLPTSADDDDGRDGNAKGASSSAAATAATAATEIESFPKTLTPLLVACQEGAAGAVALLLRDGNALLSLRCG